MTGEAYEIAIHMDVDLGRSIAPGRQERTVRHYILTGSQEAGVWRLRVESMAGDSNEAYAAAETLVDLRDQHEGADPLLRLQELLGGHVI
jgi:hypothetical protein